MGIKEDYQKAMELAKAGKLEQAQALLVTINHPKAEALLEKVNRAIAARGNQVKAKPKANRLAFVIGGTLLTLLLLIGGLTIGSYVYNILQANQQAARIRAADIYCHGYFAVEYMDLEREDFNTACELEAQSTALVYTAEIDLCLSQSQNGELTQRLLDCMEAEGVFMLGSHMEDAR
jgi:hypothetical protein